MHWHTVRYDAARNRVEIYRHDEEMLDGDPVILIDEKLDKFGQTPESAEMMARWLGRVLLVDNPAVSKALGLG
jgi:hypothetical protein